MPRQTRWIVFTVLIRSTPLLAHFVRHYAALGFTDCVIAVHPECPAPDWDYLAALSPLALHREKCYKSVSTGGRDSLVVSGLRAMYIDSLETWHSVADVDEF